MLFTERGSIVSILAFSLRVPVIAQEIPFQGWDRFPLFGSVSQRVPQTKVRSFFDEFVELVDKPSSVVDNHSSRRQITLPLKQPTRTLDGPPIEFLFGLATSGVYLAARCYQRHGVLLPHPFTLTVFTAVCSLLHWSSAHAARTLSGTLPFVARTFLSFTCPTRSCEHG